MKYIRKELIKSFVIFILIVIIWISSYWRIFPKNYDNNYSNNIQNIKDFYDDPNISEKDKVTVSKLIWSWSMSANDADDFISHKFYNK